MDTGCVDLLYGNLIRDRRAIAAASEVVARATTATCRSSRTARGAKRRRTRPSGRADLEELEQRYILQTLARMGQNRTRTAAALGISLRAAVQAQGIPPGQSQRADSIRAGFEATQLNSALRYDASGTDARLPP